MEIEEQMNLSPLKLKQDVPTRWNSTYDMLMRFLKVKEALIATLAIMRPDLSLPQDDWTIIEKATELLKIFYDVTLEISGEQYDSASKYIVLCKIIISTLNKYSACIYLYIGRLLIALKSQMHLRFGEAESNVLLCEATILDPRFKKSGFSDLNNFNRAASALKLRTGSERTLEPFQVEPVVHQKSTPSAESGSIWDEFDAEIAVLVPQNPTAAGIVEFDKYIEEPLLKRTENTILWWSDRESVYPRLYKYMLNSNCR